MRWNQDEYPAAMKPLSPPVREKAVEIANALLDEGLVEARAISMATAQAKRWAREQDIPIYVDDDKNDSPS